MLVDRMGNYGARKWLTFGGKNVSKVAVGSDEHETDGEAVGPGMSSASFSIKFI